MNHQLQHLVAIATLGVGCVSATPTQLIEAWGGVAQAQVGRQRIAAAVAPVARAWVSGASDGVRSQLERERCVPDGAALVYQTARGQVRELALAVAQVAVERELRVAAEARLAVVMMNRSVLADARVDGWQ